MLARSLAVLFACMLMGCASGASDDGEWSEAGSSGDDGALPLEAGPEAATRTGDSGAGGTDTGSASGDDGSSADTGTVDTGSGDDSGGMMVQDTGTMGSDTGTGPTACPNTLAYAAKAIAAAGGSNPVFCPLSPSVCPAADCCYEQASPISICVVK